jgi:hypothetical protein
MKTKVFLLLATFLISLIPGYAQLGNQKRKKFREEKKLRTEEKIDQLVNSKNFVFTAKTALPSGGPSIDLTTNFNSVKFSPEKITSAMPFFGQAYSIDYGGDAGYKFEAKPEVFDVKKLKKNKGYEIVVKVPVSKDKIDMRLNVGSDGSSTLTILSFQRKSISYIGRIQEPDKKVIE